jgi:hypothetical protein
METEERQATGRRGIGERREGDSDSDRDRDRDRDRGEPRAR